MKFSKELFSARNITKTVIRYATKTVVTATAEAVIEKIVIDEETTTQERIVYVSGSILLGNAVGNYCRDSIDETVDLAFDSVKLLKESCNLTNADFEQDEEHIVIDHQA